MNEAHQRKSFIALGEIVFWTATICKWQRLLLQDSYKDVIIESLHHLSRKGKIEVFAFVIMPNHLHLIWRINALNGKETPQGSLLKFTAHQFKKKLQKENNEELNFYKVTAAIKDYEFWQRDSLAVPLYTKSVAYQKLDYIHYNPLATHWQLVDDPCLYQYSSAAFYEQNKKHFSFLRDLREEF